MFDDIITVIGTLVIIWLISVAFSRKCKPNTIVKQLEHSCVLIHTSDKNVETISSTSILYILTNVFNGVLTPEPWDLQGDGKTHIISNICFFFIESEINDITLENYMKLLERTQQIALLTDYPVHLIVVAFNYDAETMRKMQWLFGDANMIVTLSTTCDNIPENEGNMAAISRINLYIERNNVIITAPF